MIHALGLELAPVGILQHFDAVLLFLAQLAIIYIFWGLSQDEWIKFDQEDTQASSDNVDDSALGQPLVDHEADESVAGGYVITEENVSECDPGRLIAVHQATESYVSQSILSKSSTEAQIEE